MKNDLPERNNQPPISRFWVVVEIAFVLLLFFVYAGSASPGTNEAHYLTRAKHFWNPDWCSRDLFLSSPEAHPVFHTVFGWLTRFFDLPQTAIIGRAIGWTALAVGWVRISRSYVRQRMMSVMTAAIAVALWDRAHMAGEWIVGGFEAKVLSFVFVFFALDQVINGRWRSGTIVAGIAAAFHPLVGGWALVAMALSWLFEKSDPSGDRLWKRFRHLFPALVIAALLSLLGVWPALDLDSGADAITRLGARRIYVHWRLGHHLVPIRTAMRGDMPWFFIARHVLLIVGWLVAWRMAPRSANQDRLQRIIAGCMLIGLVGATIELITMPNWKFQTAWMRYYWYRMTDAMVPLGFSLALAGWIARWLGTDKSAATAKAAVQAKGQIALAAVLVLVSASLVGNFRDRRSDPRPPADQQGRIKHGTLEQQQAEHADWLNLCRWCREFSNESDLFLTPTYFQTFKWYAGRAEVATWKDVPQGASGLWEWQDRRRMCRRLGLYSETRSIGPNQVTDEPISFAEVERELAAYDTDYVIVQRRWGEVSWQRPPVFRNGSFEVYALKQRQAIDDDGEGAEGR